MRKEMHSVMVRMPKELKHWIETRSIRNHRSMSAEVVAILSVIREGEKDPIAGFERFANPSGIPGTVELFEAEDGR